MTWGQIAVGVTSAVLVLVGTWVSSRFSAKVGHQANEVSDHANLTAGWEAFSREQREWTEDRLAERDRKIGDLATEVAEIRAELDTLTSKYRIAIGYVRRLVRQLQRHVDPDDIETPPDEIVPDL
ncbi:hypothetical protein NCCP2495_05240 [Dietzia sp. NCCP-2495]|uniref:hypothetical protein n=1 Tax=Dietzia sp. NCCP-2495 TaxID=2934675 RepID=UPI002230AAB6|nr:hypothetical protein [Dietzia sp. NCCP-2495]GLB62646.1 hypothetical protein NCCP2495_05240 [Dietzia sp. NCCP-2495]